jgi:hypothetical protein
MVVVVLIQRLECQSPQRLNPSRGIEDLRIESHNPSPQHGSSSSGKNSSNGSGNGSGNEGGVTPGAEESDDGEKTQQMHAMTQAMKKVRLWLQCVCYSGCVVCCNGCVVWCGVVWCGVL